MRAVGGESLHAQGGAAHRLAAQAAGEQEAAERGTRIIGIGSGEVWPRQAQIGLAQHHVTQADADPGNAVTRDGPATHGEIGAGRIDPHILHEQAHRPGGGGRGGSRGGGADVHRAAPGMAPRPPGAVRTTTQIWLASVITASLGICVVKAKPQWSTWR